MRNIIRYIIIVLVVIGIALVIRNLVTSNKDDEFTKEQTRPYYQVTVSLEDVESGQMISGSELVIKNESGEVIEKWTTNGEEHVIERVPKGNYTLEQNSVPDGYSLNEDVLEFSVSNDNLKLTMHNEAIDLNEEDNNSSTEDINVVNTLAFNNPFVELGGILFVILGIMLIYYNRNMVKL